MIPRRLPFARLLFACLLLVPFLLVANLISAQKDSPGSSQSSDGLRGVTLTTPKGNVKVALPDDIRAGDTISGTVMSEPNGKDLKERKENQDRLLGYTIDIDNQKTKVSSGEIHFVVANDPNNEPRLTLLDEKGEPLAQAFLTLVRPAELSTANSPYFPPLGQIQRPYTIRGVFDGNSANTKVMIGGFPVMVIVESPRQIVVGSPLDVVGPTKVYVNDNGATTTGSFRNLKIDLTAPKTSLLKGESTELHVQVQGLEGLNQPIPIQLQNQTPSNINLSGGNTQNILIQPSQVTTGGTFNWSGTVTATGTGGFNITGTIPSGVTTTPSPSPVISTTTPTPTPAPSLPPPSGAAVSPAASPSPASSPRTSPQVFPTPAPIGSPESTFTKADTDCCKRFLNADGAFEVSDDKGNGFKIFRNKLTMKIDGQEYEWEFTQDGKPFYIEWIFCHLNDNQIISQLSQVMVQRVKGGNSNESGSTTGVTLSGPYRDDKSRRPSYGFQFGAQKIGTDTKEYGVSFSMDSETCAWSCQLIAEGKVEEFRTSPARSPNQIFNALNNSVGLPGGATAYQQLAWWNAMYSYFSEIEDWILWLNGQESGDLDDTIQNYNMWRTKLKTALQQMLGSATPEDKSLINQMLELLENEHPSPEQIKQIGQKFDSLHLRYGTKVPPAIRNQILRNL